MLLYDTVGRVAPNVKTSFLLNDMLNIANIYSSARCIKILVYLQLVFLISSPESGLSFSSSSSSQCDLH